MFHGIRRRWMINSLGLAFLIVVVGITAYAIAAANYYTTSARSSLESRALATAGFFSRYYINTSYNEFYQGARRFAEDFTDRDKLELQFVNRLGRVDISTASVTVGFMPGTPDVREALTTGTLRAFTGEDILSHERVMSVSAPLVYGGSQLVGVMRYVTSMSEVDGQILMSGGMAFVFGIVLIAFVAISNLFFIRSIITPLREVTEIAKKIAGGSYGAKIEKKYDDEIGDLTDTINNMSAAISLSEKIKNDFISGVSHELRTPLTAISGWGETLLQTDLKDASEVKKGIRIMLKEASRLTKMVEELLEFTRMEGGRMTLQMEEMDLRSEFEEVVYLYMDKLAHDGILLNYDESTEIPMIHGDRARLRQVFLNVLDNAVKHGGDGRRIDASIHAEKNDVFVRIRDYGEGIAPDELPHVKFKFYKGKSKARGSGIGLAVSDEIVRLHDGSLDIESELGVGTCVTIRLPLHIGG